MKIAKSLLSVTLALVFVFSAVGCGGTTATIAAPATAVPATAANPTAIPAEPTAEPITITFWNSFTGSDADTLKSIVSDYNQQNTDEVTVEMDIMSSDVFRQKVPPAIATNTAPDLITLNVADLLAYEKAGSIEDLSDLFTATGLDKSDFLPASLQLGFLDNKQYGAPMQLLDTTNLYWNKDLFTAAGLDPDKPPTTFEELATYAVKLTDATKNQYGFGMCASAAPQFYAVFIKGNGGDAVDPSTNKSVLNSAANLATFEYLHTLAFTDGVTPKSTGGVAMDNLMQSGQLGMYIDGPWLVPGLQSHNINFGVGQVPSGSAGTFAILDGTLFAIPTGTDAAHKTAVYSFLKYWNSTSVAKKWSLADGLPPYLYSVIDDPDIKANALISIFAENAKAAAPWIGGIPTAGTIDSDVLFPLIEQLQNAGNVTDMVTEASNQIDVILQGQ